MIYPPPGVCPRCGAQTKPYAVYRVGVAPLANNVTTDYFPWGCLLGLVLVMVDRIGLWLNVGGMGQRRTIARIREEQFRQNDLTMVCTRCTWTEAGDTPLPA